MIAARTILALEWTEPVNNDPALARRMSATLATALGPANVIAADGVAAEIAMLRDLLRGTSKHLHESLAIAAH